MNLVINGAEAISEEQGGGQVYVRTATRQITADDIAADFAKDEIEPGPYLMIEVRDTGVGIDEAAMSKIFDPFFTTKLMGRGLGLAATLGIVKSHRGAIHVYSAPGEGSTFTVWLPVLPAKAETRSKKRGRQELKRGSGTILLIDDDVMVRQVAERALSSFGYQVLVADRSDAGIRTLQEHRDGISLVILDLSMPGSDGEQTIKELKKREVTYRSSCRAGTKKRRSSGDSAKTMCRDSCKSLTPCSDYSIGSTPCWRQGLRVTLPGNERAQWIGSQRIAGRLIRARSRPSAQSMILAGAAAVRKRSWIVQQSKNGSAAVDFRDPVGSHVAGDLRKKARRTDIAGARHEYNSIAIADSETARGLAAFDLLARKPFSLHSLHRDAPIRRSLGRRDHKGRDLRGLINPRHQLLGLIRCERLQNLPPAHRDQKEKAPACNWGCL